MKVYEYQPEINSEKINKTENEIIIKRGRWGEKRDRGEFPNPLSGKDGDNFKRYYRFKHKYVYAIYRLDNKTINGNERYIKLNFFQNVKFLWFSKKHWLQQTENIMYIVNLIFLALGTYFAYLVTLN